MREKTMEEEVPVTLSALLIYRKEARKHANRWNKLLEICDNRIKIAEKEIGKK